MRLPLIALGVTASAAGATAAAATAQDAPFAPEPEPLSTTTLAEPVPAADPSAPVIAVRLPATRVGSRIKSVRITLKDPDTTVEYAQVDVKRRIRLRSGVVDQAYDGRRWYTTASTTKYRIYPDVGRHSQAHTLTFKKGLPAARYWITVKAQNDPGTARTKRVSFRTR